MQVENGYIEFNGIEVGFTECIEILKCVNHWHKDWCLSDCGEYVTDGTREINAQDYFSEMSYDTKELIFRIVEDRISREQLSLAA